MNIAAYCRVSTDKEDQLNSLETQKEYFMEYAQKHEHTLVEIYADEGITGTSTKKRKEFLRMMEDAKRHKFEMLVVKDVSRLARNTVDFLESVRTLKNLGIATYFITLDKLISPQNKESELTITIIAATAQEESGNTSKRVKFGKKRNAERGRVPNIVFGYDKTKGDYFNLSINEEEAKAIHLIFDWYINGGYGASKIAFMLNDMGIKTKRNCLWSQHSVCGILKNPIYTGVIYNGKQEVADFLTGKRADKSPSEWLKVEKPELRIIDDETFENAQAILAGRHYAFNSDEKKHGSRHSNKHLFSTLIKCKQCGYSFRRFTSAYGNHPVSWICSGRNGKGTGYCENTTRIPEELLIQQIDFEIQHYLGNRKLFTKQLVEEFRTQYHESSQNMKDAESVEKELARLNKLKGKVNTQFECDAISEMEYRERISAITSQISALQNRLHLYARGINIHQQLEKLVEEAFQKMGEHVSVRDMTNAQLKQIIDRIEADKQGHIDVYFKLLNDLGLDETILVCDDGT